MKIVTLAQQKGGVGKTTVCVNLALQAAVRGKKSAIIDLDKVQASAIKWGERRKKAGLNGPAIYTSNAREIDELLKKLKADGVEWVFIDSPGRDDPVSSSGLRVADITLVPCRPLDDDIEPSFATVKLIRLDPARRYAYLMNISPPQIDKKRARKVGEVLKNAGYPVSPVIIVQRIAVPDANAQGLGTNERDPGGQSDREYGELFKWLESELQ